MTQPEKIRVRVLVVLVGLLCLSLYYNGHSRLDITPVRAAVPVRNAAPVPVRHVSQADVLPSLSLLDRQPPLFSESRRNVFQFSEGGEEEDPVEADVEDSGMPDVDVPQSQTQTQSAPGSELSFIGVYREKGRPASRLAAVNIGTSILVVQKGDTLPGGYRVVKVEDDFLIVSLEAEKKTIRIPFGRNSGSN